MSDDDKEQENSLARRREMDELLNNRYRDTPRDISRYEDFISTIQFKSETDRHVFDRLPLSLKEKMEMLQAVINEQQTATS